MAQFDLVIDRKTHVALAVVARSAHVARAYLFGSQVEGEVGRWSDIDIAVFIEGIFPAVVPKQMLLSAVCTCSVKHCGSRLRSYMTRSSSGRAAYHRTTCWAATFAHRENSINSSRGHSSPGGR
ncbi:MAG: nucleotidyltransferase domain-containing protein [Armatimonadetes bacterium]|nr:nucleotidyltransferase domain-containing protein [Armatimonadota bacterium]